jgi:hypothetical protein
MKKKISNVHHGKRALRGKQGKKGIIEIECQNNEHAVVSHL